MVFRVLLHLIDFLALVLGVTVTAVVLIVQAVAVAVVGALTVAILLLRLVLFALWLFVVFRGIQALLSAGETVYETEKKRSRIPNNLHIRGKSV
jgi:type IV secretory pathway VirB3-like protein